MASGREQPRLLGASWVGSAKAHTSLPIPPSADMCGRRRIVLLGLTVFTVASLVCGLAWEPGPMVAARAIQGLGGAILSPATLTILTITFPDPREPAHPLGVWGAAPCRRWGAGPLAGSAVCMHTRCCPPPKIGKRANIFSAPNDTIWFAPGSAPSVMFRVISFQCSGMFMMETKAMSAGPSDASAAPAAVLSKTHHRSCAALADRLAATMRSWSSE